MHVLVLFMDGVGLAPANQENNPFVFSATPTLNQLLAGSNLVQPDKLIHGPLASLKAIDAQMGISGRPQSASGQAALLTGQPVPALLGEHYGPKPDLRIRKLLQTDNIFQRFHQLGLKTQLLNAYPERYFQAIDNRKRLHGTIPMAFTAAGGRLLDVSDLRSGHALTPDFTAHSWNKAADLPRVPELSPQQAGKRLADLSTRSHLSWFDCWITDFAGHRQQVAEAQNLIELFDQVLEGLVQSWNFARDLCILTSDHGNLEDLLTRKHTSHPVPFLILGPESLRRVLLDKVSSLADIAPAICSLSGAFRDKPDLHP